MTAAKQERLELAELRQEPISFSEQFHAEQCRLNHHSPEDFHRSQWQSELKSCGFLIYRWCLAAFFGSGLVTNIILYYYRGYWLIYLTNWGFVLCSLASITGAIFVSIYHCNPERMMRRTCLIKCYWALYWTNLIVSNIICILYWILIFPRDRGTDNPMRLNTLNNIWTHALPPFFFTIDHMVVAQPARIMHFIYPLGFSLAYVAFSCLYYLLGYRDPRGHVYIYPMLDYRKLGIAIRTIALTTILLITCSILQYGVYRLRVFIARKLNRLQ
ncbi:protein rolling stone [Drosophila novamexicana]|uniref:protein rolling stone n=1 Tax=Drosophila novamexicana TaxID=47314 RepID=UPI0011E5B9DD|nr:protein rolling stone [Drosophila novamexicana]